MRTGRARALIGLLLAAALLAPPVAADTGDGGLDDAPNQLSEAEDNAAEGHDTCGGEPTSPAGSRVVRRLVDGPRQADGTLAFVAGICIYVPPGYEGSGLRYPVLYLLHGASGWQDDWFVQGDAQATLDAAYAEDPANAMIVVAPDGTNGGRWLDDPAGHPRNETYLFDHVIPYVDTYLRTIPIREARAIAGLSNGGAGATRLGALHPDHFAAVVAQSGAQPVNTGNPLDVQALCQRPHPHRRQPQRHRGVAHLGP